MQRKRDFAFDHNQAKCSIVCRGCCTVCGQELRGDYVVDDFPFVQNAEAQGGAFFQRSLVT